MITTISKASAETVGRAAAFTFANKTFLSEAFPDCKDRAAVAEALKRSGEKWNVLVTDTPMALFALEVTGTQARVDHFLPENAEIAEQISSSLRDHFLRMKIGTLTMNVSDEFADSLTRSGLTKRSMIVRLTRRVAQTRLMPMLPLSNPSVKDIPALAKLMQESYATGGGSQFKDLTSVERC